MTTIVWDGETLAADRMCCHGTLKYSVTKIKKVNGHLLFCAGSYDTALALYAWFENGAKASEFPATQNNNERWEPLNIITPERQILRYERTPHPFQIHDAWFACGSGRDYALGALACGKNAAEAVMIAQRFDPHTGLGIDLLTLED